MGINVGDKVKAKSTDNICDQVTKDKIYDVVETYRIFDRLYFKIINDKGNVILPTSTIFSKVIN